MHPLTLDDFEYENYADIFIVKQVPENKNELPLENIRLFLIYFFNKRKLDMYFIKAGAFIIKTNRITCILIFGYTKKYSPLKKSAQIQQLLNSDSDCYIFKNYREFDVYINHTASLYKNPKSSPRNFKTIRGALFCIFEVFTKKEITQSLPAVLPVYTNKIFYLYNWELLRTNKKRELLKGLYQAFYSNLAKDFSAKMGCDTPQLKDFYNNFYNRYINIEYIDELMYRKFFSVQTRSNPLNSVVLTKKNTDVVNTNKTFSQEINFHLKVICSYLNKLELEEVELNQEDFELMYSLIKTIKKQILELENKLAMTKLKK